MEKLIFNIMLFFAMSETAKLDFLPKTKSTYIYNNDTQSKTGNALFFFVYKSFTLLRHFYLTDEYGGEKFEEIVEDMTSLMEIMFDLKRNRHWKWFWNIQQSELVGSDNIVFWNILRRLSREFLGPSLVSSKMTMDFEQMKAIFMRLNYDE